MATPAQIRALQAARRGAGISDEDWRAKLSRDCGVTSTKDVPASAVGRLLDSLNGVRKPLAAGAVALDGPYAAKLRALWITGYHLGVIHDRTDKAMLSFIERQTGIEHTRFLRAADDARRAIEGLKAWIGREAGLDWPKDTDGGHATKLAIVRRQWHLLTEAQGGTIQTEAMDLDDYAFRVARGPNHYGRVETLAAEELDKVMPAIGAKLRAYRDWVSKRDAARAVGAAR